MNRDGEFAGTRSVPVAIGIGSNLGARLKHLAFARDHLGGLLVDSRFSRIYESEPMHVREQPAFLNACCVGRTRLAAPDLLERLQRLERARGRIKTGRRYGPRQLDLDILLYGDLVIDSPGLRVPHPRLPERAFVLVPLAELAPEWVHPERDQTVGELAAGVSSTGVSMHQPSTVDQPAWSEGEDDA